MSTVGFHGGRIGAEGTRGLDPSCKSTAGRHYATMFFGVYDDRMRRLTYVDCGHNPPILLRDDGPIERLDATATVIGLFETWECSALTVDLYSGDLLVLFSDGVTEPMHGEEEFGESRLMGELQSVRRASVEQIVASILAGVAFSGGEQSDDVTLVAARVR